MPPLKIVINFKQQCSCSLKLSIIHWQQPFQLCGSVFHYSCVPLGQRVSRMFSSSSVPTGSSLFLHLPPAPPAASILLCFCGFDDLGTSCKWIMPYLSVWHPQGSSILYCDRKSFFVICFVPPSLPPPPLLSHCVTLFNLTPLGSVCICICVHTPIHRRAHTHT